LITIDGTVEAVVVLVDELRYLLSQESSISAVLLLIDVEFDDNDVTAAAAAAADDDTLGKICEKIF
jgi:hypothetical protein